MEILWTQSETADLDTEIYENWNCRMGNPLLQQWAPELTSPFPFKYF
jgi:hypothetical protein